MKLHGRPEKETVNKGTKGDFGSTCWEERYYASYHTSIEWIHWAWATPTYHRRIPGAHLKAVNELEQSTSMEQLLDS